MICDICFLISEGLGEILISSHEIKFVGCKKSKKSAKPSDFETSEAL